MEYRTCLKCKEIFHQSVFWHPTVCCFVPSIWVDCGIALEGDWYNSMESEFCQETVYEFPEYIDEDDIAELMRVKKSCLDELKLKFNV
jgi:hypothetical protein